MGDTGLCPHGSERVDETAARLNGAIVVAVLALAILPPLHWLLFYLLLDFAVKVFAGFAVSPNSFFAVRLSRLLRLPARPIPAAPKRFAAVVAIVFLCGALMSWYSLGSFAAGAAFAGVFATCAALEAGAGFCVGCWVYGHLPVRMAQTFVR
jgi:hypothetical protein